MSELLTISGVRGYVDDKGVAQLNLEDVARGLGFTQRAASGNEVVRWERVNKYLTDFGIIPTSGDGYIPENIFYRLAMKAKNAVAEAFQAEVADEILPAIRRHGMYATDWR
ncbi:BRO-N domain-containing protein [Paenibacillus pinihumi]|uniref:BRO-N domain-containing protein n=1 Tax=Paenibacillus pinihumi TaxID=669462 RepID=UPI000688E302|nr:BRO family protein [Paenibacillus pinihumi]